MISIATSAQLNKIFSNNVYFNISIFITYNMSKHKIIQRPGYLSNVARNGSLEMYNVQIELLITTNASRNKKLMFNCSFVSNSPCGFLFTVYLWPIQMQSNESF